MAIVVWTNSNVSVNTAVKFTSLSISGYNYDDDLETLAITKTPFVSNNVSTSNPYNVFLPAPVINTTVAITSYSYDDDSETVAVTKNPLVTPIPSAPGYIPTNGKLYVGNVTYNQVGARDFWTTG